MTTMIVAPLPGLGLLLKENGEDDKEESAEKELKNRRVIVRENAKIKVRQKHRPRNHQRSKHDGQRMKQLTVLQAVPAF